MINISTESQQAKRKKRHEGEKILALKQSEDIKVDSNRPKEIGSDLCTFSRLFYSSIASNSSVRHSLSPLPLETGLTMQFTVFSLKLDRTETLRFTISFTRFQSAS